jgi:putative spermidine/putrescine transport system substrate-binding protein
MSDRGVIPQELLDQLPSADLYANIEFPTPEQSDKATQTIADGWDAVAG